MLFDVMQVSAHTVHNRAEIVMPLIDLKMHILYMFIHAQLIYNICIYIYISHYFEIYLYLHL